MAVEAARRGHSPETASRASLRPRIPALSQPARPIAVSCEPPRLAPVCRVPSKLINHAFDHRCELAAVEVMPAEEEPGAAMEGRECNDGSPQQFCLRWNNYQSNLASSFDQLLQTESFVDVTLACEGQSLKAHKVVLSACSPYFQTLFMDNPCRHPIIIMRDIKYCDLKAVVDFMYRGEINVSQDQITALLKVAETLKIRGLTDVSGDHAVLRSEMPNARPPKRPASHEAEERPKSRRLASVDRSPGPSPRLSPPTPGPTPPDSLGAPSDPPPPPLHGAVPMPPLHPEDVDIRPGIAEMIREEERVSVDTYKIIFCFKSRYICNYHNSELASYLLYKQLISISLSMS